jgi:hypothetical protein
MIIMPAWVTEETEEGYHALLGSEPKTDSKSEFLPKECVDNIIYAPMIHESGYKFAMFTLNENNLPQTIRDLLKK